MLEKPNIPDDLLIACLRDQYNRTATSLEFLPIGYDATAWVYRVQADDGAPWFLKLKKGAIYEPSVLVPRFLQDSGIPQVVAPLPSVTGALWANLNDDYAAILYPFIEGENGMDAGLSDDQWVLFGRVLKAIHSITLPDDLHAQVRKETFTPPHQWLEMIMRLDAHIQTAPLKNDFERELAAFWAPRQAEIQQIVGRTVALGRMLQAKSGSFALCHADIHTANLLLTPDGDLRIVDWDQPILAPVERDLMFVVGDDRTQPKETQHFLSGYGPVSIDPLALAYYRYEWVVQELGDFGERIFYLPDVGDETRADSVRGFRQLFDPGDVVEAAYRAAANLPPEDATPPPSA